MAAGYFSDIGVGNESVADLCAPLRSDYLKIAENLKKASSKTMDSDEKRALLKETKELETTAIGKVEKLAEALRSRKGMPRR